MNPELPRVRSSREAPAPPPSVMDYRPERLPSRPEVEQPTIERPPAAPVETPPEPPQTPVPPVAVPPQPPAQVVLPPDDTTTLYSPPSVAADDDLIEKEWVEKLKKIISLTRDDPYERARVIAQLQADYLKKRYNKIVK